MEVSEEILVVKIKPSSYQYSRHRVNKTHEWESKTIVLGKTLISAVCRTSAGKEDTMMRLKKKKAFIS